MAAVTQTIPNFIRGISEQSDDQKFPGQVSNILNAIPDPVLGLHKRPGSKRIGTNKLANVADSGKFFHYHRDEDEGNYIGQVDDNGVTRMWSCTTGLEMDVKYASGQETAIKAYLATTGANNPGDSTVDPALTKTTSTGPNDNIRTLTINDTTFISNKDITNVNTEPKMFDSYTEGWGTSGTDAEAHFCFIDLLRIENGRQYSLNVSDDETVGTAVGKPDHPGGNYPFNLPATGETAGSTIYSATRLKLVDHTTNPLSEANGTGTCKGIGTQVFSAAETNHHNPAFLWQTNQSDIKDEYGNISSPNANTDSPRYRHNLSFRITVAGQQGLKPDASNQPSGGDYQCKYDRKVTLLHGGEGWKTGDTCLVEMTTSKGAVDGASPEGYTKSAYHKVEVTDHELIKHKANIVAARPVPTPFDSDTSISADAVLGGIINALNNTYQWGKNTPANPPTHNHTTGFPPSHNSTATGGYYNKTGNAMLMAPSGDTLNIKADGESIKFKIIGTGIYLYCKKPFNVEVLNQDLMRVMHREVNSVADLPKQCRDGYVVRVLNFENSQDDDYYVKFVGENGRDGAGSWVECARPMIRKGFNQATMPVVIQRLQDNAAGDATGTAGKLYFQIKQWTWAERKVGDNRTNPKPTFVKTDNRQGTRINKCIFFRNRFGLLVGENVMLSRPGTVAEPDFWANTALTISAIDPIDIACASLFPSPLFDAIELASGLLCFSTNQQFLLTSDDTILDPNTAKLKPIASYNYNKDLTPISLGITIAFIDNSAKYSRLNEVVNVTREGEPIVSNTTLVVPTLIPKNADIITNSRENNLVFVGQSYRTATASTSDLVFGFKYLPPTSGNMERKQGAWFKWRLSNPVKHMFCINDDFFFVDSDNFLQRISLMQDSDEPVIDDDQPGDFLVHLDNYVSIKNGSYSTTTGKTTFSGVSWLSDVDQKWATHSLVLVDTKTDGSSTRIGRYAVCDVSGTSFTVPGDWEETNDNILYVGYLYTYRVRFPKFYLKKKQGESVTGDINNYLTLHRVKLHFGQIGLYKTILSRTGKTDYEDLHESTPADQYEVSDAPYLNEDIKTIPIYEKNTNVTLTLTSEHPAPATLKALSWEGDYSPLGYRRV